MDERSEKIKEIVDKYRNGEGKLFLPSNPDLEDELVRSWGLSVDNSPQQILVPSPDSTPLYRENIAGTSTEGLYEFISEKSTLYQILLVHHIMEVLGHKNLEEDLHEYELKLAKYLRETLYILSCKEGE